MYKAVSHTPKRKAARSNRAGDAEKARRRPFSGLRRALVLGLREGETAFVLLLYGLAADFRVIFRVIFNKGELAYFVLPVGGGVLENHCCVGVVV